MNDVLALAEENQRKAWRVVEASGLIAAWKSIRDGVRTWPEFAEWRKLHPADGIIDWMP